MMETVNVYGECPQCGGPLSPVWFLEEEYVKGIRTGRKRKACSHLLCDRCGHIEIVDDSFDGPWY